MTQDFDQLKVMIRYKVDACVETKKQNVTRNPPRPAKPAVNVEDPAGAPPKLGTDKPTTPQASRTSPKINIIDGGELVPQSSIIELTTRSAGSDILFDWVEAFRQLFLLQIPKHFLAYHRNGRFLKVEKRKLGDGELGCCEAILQRDFSRLRSVLGRIKELVQKEPNARLALVCHKGKMSVHARTDSDGCLPAEWIKRFEPEVDPPTKPVR